MVSVKVNLRSLAIKMGLYNDDQELMFKHYGYCITLIKIFNAVVLAEVITSNPYQMIQSLKSEIMDVVS
jgi:hypothetical protein